MEAVLRQIDLDSLRIGQRHRRDVGDIAALAQSIQSVGLLQPIVIRPDGTLVAGMRRVEALRSLGKRQALAYVAETLDDELALLRAERDENTCRLDFSPLEAVEMGRAIEEREREEARARQATGWGTHEGLSGSGNFPEPTVDTGQTRDKVGAVLGMSGKTYEKAKAVIDAAEEEPELFGDLPEVMHDKRKVEPVYQEMRRRESRRELEDIERCEAQALQGTYDVIVIDPPWPMEKIERDERPNQVSFDYPTMTEAELDELALPCAEDCHIWLWATQRFLPMAFRLLDAWGLKYVCAFVWHKPGGFQSWGLPQYNCEFALYARRGSPAFIDTKAFSVCFEAPRRGHSVKPDLFYERVRRVTAGRRLDMFSRRAIDGFDGWGKEADSGG